MKFGELCQHDERLLALHQEAQILAGTLSRIAGFPPSGKPKANFCKYQWWHGARQSGGEVGAKFQLQEIAEGSPLVAEHWDLCYHAIFNAAPGCTHPDDGGMCHADFEVPPTTPGMQSLKRDTGPKGFADIVSQAREMSARDATVPPTITYTVDSTGQIKEETKYKYTEAPPVVEWIDGSKPVPDDKDEPVFVVRDEVAGRKLAFDLRFRERYAAGEISLWYLRNAIYICDAAARKELLATTLSKETMTGALSWKPVVLTFKDAELERKLSAVCVQVVTVEGTKDKSEPHTKAESIGTLDLEQVHESVKKIKSAVAIKTQDMPSEVLDGWLGDVCQKHMAKLPRALAWPALLTAASVYVTKPRVNLYTSLIGPVGSGKTSAFELAFWLLNVKSPVLMRLKAGSSEGMAELIGDASGAPRLVFVDEFAHLLAKVNYEGSTFEQFLNDAYYGDLQELTVARRKHILFNCRLTLAGGLPENKFEDLFGVGTAGGFHNRVAFGLCPTKFEPFPWKPLDGDSPLAHELSPSNEESEDDVGFGSCKSLPTGRPQPIVVDPAVWEEKTRWQKDYGISGRAAEAGIRAAIICAAFDCRDALQVSQLGPALVFARYQEEVHKRFEPNPGKTNEAIVAHKTLTYLKLHAPDGEQWVNRREMFRTINAYDFGPTVATRALGGLESTGEIEQVKSGRQWLVRLNPKNGGGV